MRLTINHYIHSKSTVVNLSYMHAQTDLHELGSFWLVSLSLPHQLELSVVLPYFMWSERR